MINARSINNDIERLHRGTRYEMLFLCLREKLGKNVAVWWGNVCVVVLDGVCDLKTKFLVKI